MTSFLVGEGGWFESKNLKRGKEIPIKEINTPPSSLSSTFCIDDTTCDYLQLQGIGMLFRLRRLRKVDRG